MLKRILLVMVLLMSVTVGVYAESNYIITYEGKGIVQVERANSKDNMKILISKGDSKKNYVFGKITERIPLDLGKGTYEVKILDHVEGTRYKVVHKKSIHLNEDIDEKTIYTQSINKIDFEDDQYIKELSDQLYKDESGKPKLLSTERKVHILYDYLTKVTYDYDKVPTLTTNYMPDTKTLIKENKGICYDYASVFAGVLRLNNIPTKLVTGYAGTDTYHAWNEVLIGDEWKLIDTTYDSVYRQYGVKYTIYKNSSNYKVDKTY